MQKARYSYFVILLVSASFIGCQEDKGNVSSESDIEIVQYAASEIELNYKQYALYVDADTSLRKGNSLYYSREDGATMEVFISVDDEDETIKIEELYSNAGSASLCSNTFYFKNGKKNISRELFEEGNEVTGNFTERISYYDEKEIPIQTLERKAEYEDQLEFEQFSVVKKYNCSTKRALMVLNQEGEFASTFQGFISEGPYLYLIVGENEKTGFTSSLVVQYQDQTIQELKAYDKEMIGKGIQVEFETLSSQGYEYQILKSIRLR
ncbi:MAG: hypothetical protein QNK85_04150 [Crocinitomicaceae bacterium]